jgi:hypothetical protein
MIDTTPTTLITRQYVDDEIAFHGERIDLVSFYEELLWFVKACDKALGEMREMSRRRFWRDGLAWQNWIKQLTKIAEVHQLPTAARKDTDKSTLGKVSPFVAFVHQFQNYIPVGHRRAIQSIEALSVAINTARRRSKSPVQRVR